MTLLKPYDWEYKNIFREESPFARPSVFEGYPMSKKDKEVIKKSLENLDNNYLGQKYICPQRHECYESEKEFMRGYVFCPECEHKEPYMTVAGTMSKGLYIPICMCEKIND